MQDAIVHMTLLGGTARALVVLSTQTTTIAKRTHGLSPTATAALGRTLTGTAMLASMLKGEQNSMTVTLQGGGPLGKVVCVGYPNGQVKGYVDQPLADPPRQREGKLDVGAAIGQDGFMTVIKDLGFGQPYIGRTALVSGEVAEDFAYYLAHSEQTPSMVALGVLVKGEEVLGSGGILLQPLPFCPEQDIAILETLSSRLAHISTLAHEATDAAHLAALCFGDMEREVLLETPLSFSCGCDRERIEKILLSLGEQELRDMIKEQHGAQLTCHFCNQCYDFAKDDLERLIEEGLQ